jgi:DEAD/DEAH box helicase
MAVSPSLIEGLLRGPEDRLREQAFEVTAGISALFATGNEAVSRTLLIRALARRDALSAVLPMLDSLARRSGLFPYVSDPSELGTADRIAYEMQRPLGIEDLVFHAEQAEVYRLLVDGHNVVLSAPTSFGKSLIIDGIIATGKFRTVALIVPTIALIDETRRRLVRRFRHQYKLITRASQQPGDKTIYILTQERLLDLGYEQVSRIQFFAIDEFYKLDMEREEERKCQLNQAFHRLYSTGAQFYLLGPRVSSLTRGLEKELRFRFVHTDFETVVLDTEIHGATFWTLDESVISACRSVRGPTLLYVRSPERAHQLARALLKARLGQDTYILQSAGDWVAKSYHPDWLVGRALRQGIGIHHGRIPRALAHHVVRLFNSGQLPYLVVTSTLIEGVNTAAANVLIVDNKCARKHLDFFTYNNIRGRSGRMFRHFVGKVIVFGEPPKERKVPIDIPVFSQGDSASPALLIQLPWSELTASSREKLKPYYEQDTIKIETIRLASGIDPARIMDLARLFHSDPARWSHHLSWTGQPNFAQLEEVCKLAYKLSGTRGMRSGVTSGRQLATRLNILRRNGSNVKAMVQDQLAFRESTTDDAVQDVLDFIRHWAIYQFPRLLMIIEAISRDVLSRYDLPSGSYAHFAQAVESQFRHPAFAVLEEYGLPTPLFAHVLNVLPWLQVWLNGDVDSLLNVLREVSEVPGLTGFEADMWADTIESL